MMSTTAEFPRPLGEVERALNRAIWSAVAVIAGVGALFVVSVMRSMAATHTIRVAIPLQQPWPLPNGQMGGSPFPPSAR